MGAPFLGLIWKGAYAIQVEHILFYKYSKGLWFSPFRPLVSLTHKPSVIGLSHYESHLDYTTWID